MNEPKYKVGDIVEIARTNVKWEGDTRTATHSWATGEVVKVWPYGLFSELHCEVHGVKGGEAMLTIINCDSRGIRHLGEDKPHPEVW